MSKNLFAYTIPSLLRGLGVLSGYLERIQHAVDDRAFVEDELLKARLADDMLPLGRQIQIACDNAKNGPARLTGHNAPWFKDEETHLAQYRHRVEKTIAYVRSFTPRDFHGSEARMIDHAFPGVNYTMPGGDYVRDILLPNFHFHVAIAHAILRHKGLSIGKRDYLGNLPATAAEVSEPTGGHRPIEFLTSCESIQWVARRGLAEHPIDSRPEFGYFQFVPQPLSVTIQEMISALVDELGGFSGGLLLLTDWIWDDEYDVDPTAGYREAMNESRSLGEVPGFLFAPENLQEASELLALVIERSWTGRFYFATGVIVLQLCEGYKVDVYTRDPDVERLVRYRLITLGAAFSQP
jgi:hypothetical protein